MSRPLTIWEMRNDVFMGAFAEKICHFNYNKEARDKVLQLQPMTKLYIEETIKEWHPQVVLKLDQIRTSLDSSKKKFRHIASILDSFQETFLFPDA